MKTQVVFTLSINAISKSEKNEIQARASERMRMNEFFSRRMAEWIVACKLATAPERASKQANKS